MLQVFNHDNSYEGKKQSLRWRVTECVVFSEQWGCINVVVKNAKVEITDRGGNMSRVCGNEFSCQIEPLVLACGIAQVKVMAYLEEWGMHGAYPRIFLLGFGGWANSSGAWPRRYFCIDQRIYLRQHKWANSSRVFILSKMSIFENLPAVRNGDIRFLQSISV